MGCCIWWLEIHFYWKSKVSVKVRHQHQLWIILSGALRQDPDADFNLADNKGGYFWLCTMGNYKQKLFGRLHKIQILYKL